MATKKQLQIYAYIEECTARQGYPPTVREIGAAVGLSSPATVQFHLNRLRDEGLLEKGYGKNRSIMLTGPTARRIPVLGTVRAGAPILAVEEVEGYLPYDCGGAPDEFFALRIRGDSMIDAGILEGDCVVVRRQEQADSGDIVVALLEDEATVKRLRLRDGHVFLQPENPAYEPIPGDGCSILGVVTALVRRFK